MKVIQPFSRDLGEFVVRRSLPSSLRSVGPFVFFDHMGPAKVQMAVRPHPHIGLATVTYLFSGEITHRDNLGNNLNIRPGAINWMTAGKGICHSERSELTDLHGLQLWVALPQESETIDPKFTHYAADILPQFKNSQLQIRLLVGQAFGHQSPVAVHSEMIF